MPVTLATTGALLKSALRLTGLGCWSMNLSTGELALSSEAERIFGRLGPDPSFASWLERVDADDAHALQGLEEQVRRGQRSFSFEYRFLRPDGTRRRLKSDGEVLSTDERGAPLVLAGTVLDLGDAASPDAPGGRRQGELALLGDTWTWEQDASYRFTSVQGGQWTLIPEMADAIGRRRWELPHTVPLHGSWQDHLHVLESRKAFHAFEYRIAQGPHASYASTTGEPFYDATGAFLGYRGTAYNITRRVKAEQEAAHAQLLLQQASRLGQLGAWTLGVPEMDVEWTHGSRQLFGHAGDAPLTWDAALACLDPASRTELQKAVAGCLVRNQPFDLEARVPTADRSDKWLRIIGQPEPAVVGPRRRVIGAIQDVSTRKEDARRLQELNQGLTQKVRERTSELQAANDELKDLAHSLAHDLRTPIAAISALAHVLEQRLQPAAEKDWHYASRLKQAAQQLDDYVEALLSHARISQVPLRASRVDLSGMAERILDDLRLREPARTVATHVQPGLIAVGDATLLQMALENLLGNAWKFTRNRPDADIRFSAEVQVEGHPTYCVTDNGDGFDMAYAHKLFGTFQRLHTQAEFPGTGVGLANVHRIVLRHGGQIWGEGSPGMGAAFYFTLTRE